MRRFVLVLLFGAAGACGSNTIAPPPPPPPVDPLTLTCPASVTVDGLAATVPVTYPAPTSAGGTAPVTTTCTPPSGAQFPVGQTAVRCTARDAAGREAVCTLDVIVLPVPRVQGTRLLAFGDSMTAGEVTAGLTPSGRSIQVVVPEKSYPSVLNRSMTSRYKGQTITVQNAGVPGEEAVAGAERLRGLLAMQSYDALMLLEGVNDLNARGVEGIPAINDALRSDIRRAKEAGVKFIMLSTLLPTSREPLDDFVVLMNDEIREIARRENVVLVDNYAAFVSRQSTLIGIDGLHPTAAGYELMAEKFFDAIKVGFELPPFMSMPFRRR